MSMLFVRVLLISLLSFCGTGGFAQDLSAEEKAGVQRFIQAVKRGDVKGLAANTAYPLKREYPLPMIRDKKAFIARYNEVFDDSLKRLIVRSSPDKDWEEVGWRGICFSQGDLWVDEDGKLIAVNRQSPAERRKWDALVREDKASLIPSLRDFLRPVCVLKTATHRIRIDEVGEDVYRYASWPPKAAIGSKPELVVEGGRYIWEGTGGNHSYEFKNGGFVYRCSIVVMGPDDDDTPATISVSKGEQELSVQRATLVQP